MKHTIIMPSKRKKGKKSQERGQERKRKVSLRASSPIWASEASLARENTRARGRGKESFQRSLISFHFHPGNPGTLQRVKTVTANMPQIRKVTTACQVSLDSGGRAELFIYKSLSQQHQGNVFNH